MELKMIASTSTPRCITRSFPRIFSEYGRYYSAFDDKIHNGVSYNDYSLWDNSGPNTPPVIDSAGSSAGYDHIAPANVR